jgi:hypothetical protein
VIRPEPTKLGASEALVVILDHEPVATSSELNGHEEADASIAEVIGSFGKAPDCAPDRDWGHRGS